MPFIPLELTAREVGLLRKLAKRRRRSVHAQGAHLIALALATGLDEPGAGAAGTDPAAVVAPGGQSTVNTGTAPAEAVGAVRQAITQAGTPAGDARLSISPGA